MTEQVPTPTPGSEQLPQYADITAEQMRRAQKTSEFIAQLATEIDEKDATPPAGVTTMHVHGSAWASPAPMGKRIAMHRAIESTDPDINVDDMEEVNGMLDEAYAENEAHDTIANGGRQTLEKHMDNVKRSSSWNTLAQTDDHVKGLKWDRQQVSQYKVNSDGTVKREGKVPDAPQQWGKDVSNHTFAPEHQERAADLVRSLAEKREAKNHAKQSQREVERAQDLVERANAPRNTGSERKAA